MRRYAARGWERRPRTEPSADGGEGRPAGESRPAVDEDGLILDDELPFLPARDRVTLIDVPRRRPSRRSRGGAVAGQIEAPNTGEILDDRIDGRRIYPEPPPLARSVDLVGRLQGRLSPLMLAFALLAWAQACIVVADAWSRGVLTAGNSHLLVLQLAYVCGVSLLPVAVLLWRKDAWRTQPLVFGGAVLWALPAALAGSIWWIAIRLPGLPDRIGYETAVIAAAASVVSCFGPAVMAFGLERVRRTPASWFGYAATRMGGVAAVLVLFNAGRWLPILEESRAGLLGGGTDAAHLVASVTGAFEPLALYGLALLAASAIWAWYEEEHQGRLWQCVAVGASLLVGTSVYELATGHLIGAVAAGSDLVSGRGSYGLTAEISLAAGGILVFLGFSSPVWSSASDAEGGHGAPDEVFAWGASSAAVGRNPIPMTTIVGVAAGADHALAVDVFGRVGAWGDDSMGQTDVPADLMGVVAVAAGDGFSMALRGDGTVVAWGAGDRGQTAVPNDLTGVRAIAAGRAFGLALRDDGTVVGWGEGSSGAILVPPELSGVTAISAGDDHALALRMDGKVVAWGDDTCGQASVPRTLGRVVAISAGGDFSLALLASGTVAAWGDGRYGQRDIPEGLGNVVAISAGAFHALALRAGGDLVGWGGGSNEQGELAHPWHLVDFKAVAAGYGFSLAVRAA